MNTTNLHQTIKDLQNEITDLELSLEEYKRGAGRDKGPWFVYDCQTIWSDDFKHDVTLKITGDFLNNEHRMTYAVNLVAKLNGE